MGGVTPRGLMASESTAREKPPEAEAYWMTFRSTSFEKDTRLTPPVAPIEPKNGHRDRQTMASNYQDNSLNNPATNPFPRNAGYNT